MEEKDLIDIDELEEIMETEEEEEKEVKEHNDFPEKKKKKLPPTDDVVVDNLVEAFALLSSMLDEAKATKENIEKVHETILKLLDVVTELRDVSEEFAKVNQIVKEINDLVKAISVNNSNIKDLIDVIYKVIEKQKKMEDDVNAIKNEMFFAEEPSSSGTKNNNWFLNLLIMLNLAFSAGMFVVLVYFIKLKGGF